MRVIAIVVCVFGALALTVPSGAIAKGHKTKVVCINKAGGKVYRVTPRRCTFHRRGEPMAEAFFVRTKHDHWRKWRRHKARGRGRDIVPMGHATQRVRIRLSDPVRKCGHRAFSAAHFFFPKTGHGASMKLDVCA
jgi:hypothetical protein